MKDVTKRFLEYVAYDTTSDPESPTCPSTPSQLTLGDVLVQEMAQLGIRDARRDEHGYVYGTLEASPGCGSLPAIGLIAHMDTSNSVPGGGIRPREILYQGGEIVLSEGIVTSPKDFPFLADLKGRHLIVTDGTTLLGADDKAGIAEILTAAEYLLAHPDIPHGRICIGFTPDEEIGRGADLFDVKGFGADFAYTLDGGAIGGVEYETFNAASWKVKVNGVNIHPGSAKNVMKNAMLIAAELISLMPAAETPAHTEGREGFYHLCGAAGDETSAKVEYIIRDHDKALFEKRKQLAQSVADLLNVKYGAGTVESEITDSYYNMREVLAARMDVVERARETFRNRGIEPFSEPVRGGTDGATLSHMGLPCPNLSTGGYNYHGVHEAVCVEDMQKMAEVLVELVRAR